MTARSNKAFLFILLTFNKFIIKGAYRSTIHPYGGIVRIRLEGIISAANWQHPLIIGCKGTKNILNGQRFWPQIGLPPRGGYWS